MLIIEIESIGMRMSRIKARRGSDGLYHCMSRIVGGDYIFGVREKEVFVRMMWRLANFLGIQVLDYVVMSNHYHQLLMVPGVVEISDTELIERVGAYYGEDSLKLRDLRKASEKGGERFDLLRASYLRRIGDISEFQKILKQSFTRWYNKHHRRRGTLWMERFKSILLEDTLDARRIIASYIDLNPVRADLVEDPKNYRHCGYAAALGGDLRCREGIMRITGIDTWEDAMATYRLCLMQRGHIKVQGKEGTISRELLLETLQREGHLQVSELVHLRVRYFSDGLVLGSEIFVEEVFEQYRSHFGEKRKSGARPIRGLDGEALKVIRDLRIDPIS